MAPEQMCPDAKPSAVADIYSFGVVLDELASATGDRLLAQVAKQCVSHNPDKRPQSVAMIKLPGRVSRPWKRSLISCPQKY